MVYFVLGNKVSIMPKLINSTVQIFGRKCILASLELVELILVVNDKETVLYQTLTFFDVTIPKHFRL